MTAPLPVLTPFHIAAITNAADWMLPNPQTSLLREVEAHVRALVSGEVVEVSSNVVIHLREAHADWLTPQTQEKP